MSEVLTRLGQRKLAHWALTYLAGAWVVLQVLALFAESLAWPAIVMRMAMPLAGAGFLATLILGWYHGEQGRQRVSATELLMLAAVLLIAGVGVYWARGARRVGADATTSADLPARRVTTYKASIPVLPFDDLAAPQESYFGEGLTEEIIGRLAEIPGLKVISRHSAVVLKRSGLTLPQIADSLGVQHILEGSVRRDNERVSVRAQLIDPRSDTQLWSQRYDRELKDIMAVQDEIAHEVSSAMLRAVNLVARSSTGTLNPRAFDAYLRGRQAVGTGTLAGLSQAAAAFRESIRLDSTYAPAYAGLAEANMSTVSFGYRTAQSSYELAGRALLLADRAVAMDPTLPDGFAVRGFVRQWTGADSAAILGDFARALELQPNSIRSRLWYATALSADGRDDEALREAAIAAELDPLTPRLLYAYSGIALAAAKDDLALAEAERARVLEPNLTAPRRRRLAALILLNRRDCVEHVEDAPLGLQAVCWSLAGNESKASDLLQRASDERFLENASYAEYEAIAAYYAWRGDAKKCVAWLRRGVQLSPYVMNPRMTGSAFYDRMWQDPEFRRAFEGLKAEIRRRVASEVRRLASAPL